MNVFLQRQERIKCCGTKKTLSLFFFMANFVCRLEYHFICLTTFKFHVTIPYCELSTCTRKAKVKTTPHLFNVIFPLVWNMRLEICLHFHFENWQEKEGMSDALCYEMQKMYKNRYLSFKFLFLFIWNDSFFNYLSTFCLNILLMY